MIPRSLGLNSDFGVGSVADIAVSFTPKLTTFAKLVDTRHWAEIMRWSAALLLHSKGWPRFSSTGFYPKCSATMRKHASELLQAEHFG
jgi:hypothetical protein